ncbi:MAG: tetratricopeptide repeat protein [Magnetococcales bacterium]|nr:tetratricopeptide repeat protein [Magnetococcales bacterium]
MNIQHILALKKALDHLQGGRPVKTMEIAARVLEQDPGNAEAWFLSGVARHQAGQALEALASLDRACQLVPDSWDYFNHRGLVHYQLGRYEECRADYEHSLVLQPDHPETLANLARLHMVMKRPELAEPLFEQALLGDPDNASLHGDLGVCRVARKNPREGVACYRAGLALDPEDADIHYNLSRALLMLGEYEEGWRENEWRWRSRHYREVTKTLPYPLWQGEALHGRTILVIQEQGFGDAIQMIRYAGLLARKGGRVRVLCDPLLRRLFAAMPSVEEAVASGTSLPHADCCVPMMSLPHLFDTRLHTIPREVPYLIPPADGAGTGWNGPPSHPAVGVIWRGKSRGQLTARALKPLFSLPGICFLSLQKDLHPGELEGLPVVDTGPLLTDFAATAAIMAGLDLIISMETAAAHLAGAMGKPVWVMIPHASEWRWLAEGTRAPWYPSALLYRQTDPDSWAPVIAHIARDLACWRDHR